MGGAFFALELAIVDVMAVYMGSSRIRDRSMMMVMVTWVRFVVANDASAPTRPNGRTNACAFDSRVSRFLKDNNEAMRRALQLRRCKLTNEARMSQFGRGRGHAALDLAVLRSGH